MQSRRRQRLIPIFLHGFIVILLFAVQLGRAGEAQAAGNLPATCPTNGDYNQDGKIDALDYARWREDFLNQDTSLVCYEYWRRAAFSLIQPSPSSSPLSPTPSNQPSPSPATITPTPPLSAMFTLCQDSAWKTTSGDNWVSYTCAQTCPEQDWRQCLHESAQGTDAQGQPLKKLAFVVDGIGGELRFNLPSAATITGGVFIMPGGGGTDLDQLLKLTGLRYPLEEAGAVVVYATFQEGFVANDAAAGWFSHSQPHQQSDFREKTARPAATIAWVRDNLLPPGTPFGTIGCSGGGLATFSSVYWHDLDDKIDLQIVGGGPPAAWDPNAACSGTPQTPEEPVGICADDPATTCTTAADCPGSHGCATLTPSTGPKGEEIVRRVKELIDYVYGVENICAAGKTDARFNSSSYRLTAGDTEYDHPLIFVIDASQLPLSDKALTTAYFAGRTFTNIHSSADSGKQWLVHNGFHCSWAYDPLFVGKEIIPRILSALKLN